MLQGASRTLWRISDSSKGDLTLKAIKTRAAENKMFIVRALRRPERIAVS